MESQETTTNPPKYGLGIIFAPLLLPLVVFLYLTLTHGGVANSGVPQPQVMLTPTPQATAIAWTNLDWALANARSLNKPIMVDFYTDT
ncbi:MAG: hypothetical protein JO316_01565 [Abitibacteriaceae bacterium]|nr:hypothetical protein [Abditibacteriaceae bacterium]